MMQSLYQQTPNINQVSTQFNNMMHKTLEYQSNPVLGEFNDIVLGAEHLGDGYFYGGHCFSVLHLCRHRVRRRGSVARLSRHRSALTPFAAKSACRHVSALFRILSDHQGKARKTPESNRMGPQGSHLSDRACRNAPALSLCVYVNGNGSVDDVSHACSDCRDRLPHLRLCADTTDYTLHLPFEKTISNQIRKREKPKWFFPFS